MRTWVLSPSSHRGLCARAGVPAGLSTTWDELRETAPNAFTIKDTANRTDHLPGLTPADPARLIQAVDQPYVAGIPTVEVPGRRIEPSIQEEREQP